MSIFSKLKPVNPVANKVPFSTTEPPLDGGENFAMKQLMNELPIDMGDKTNTEINDVSSNSCDDIFQPNMFNRWRDVYVGFVGNWIFNTSVKELKRLELLMKHCLFMYNSFTIYKVTDTMFKIGSITSDECDIFGRTTKGQFLPYNTATYKPEEKSIAIDNTNKNKFVTCSLGIFKVPLFVTLSYDINVRSYIQTFLQANVRTSSVSAIVPVKGGGYKAVREFVKNIFNLNKNVPTPIQILPVTENTSGRITTPTIKFDDSIPITTPYRGIELMKHYEFMTKEIFRKAGLRVDISSKSGESYSERNTNSQVEASNTYFDATERFILDGLDNFSYDVKELMDIETKWSSIYNLQKEEQKDEETDINKEDEN